MLEHLSEERLNVKGSDGQVVGQALCVSNVAWKCNVRERGVSKCCVARLVTRTLCCAHKRGRGAKKTGICKEVHDLHSYVSACVQRQRDTCICRTKRDIDEKGSLSSVTGPRSPMRRHAPASDGSRHAPAGLHKASAGERQWLFNRT